jgi:hypothetical protein
VLFARLERIFQVSSRDITLIRESSKNSELRPIQSSKVAASYFVCGPSGGI